MGRCVKMFCLDKFAVFKEVYAYGCDTEFAREMNPRDQAETYEEKKDIIKKRYL